MSIEENKSLAKDLLQNNLQLCPQIFNANNQLLPEVYQKLDGISHFMQEKMLGFFKDIKIIDIVICGNLCGYIYNDKTDLDLAIIIDVQDNHEAMKHSIKLLNIVFPNRGHEFKIHNHIIDYGIAISSITGCSYSLIRNQWNIMPTRREFTFDVDFFYQQYCLFSQEVHLTVKNLPKINDAFLMPESRNILTAYLDYLRETALLAKRHHPEHEYCLTYNLFRSLKHFGVYKHFRNYIKDSWNHGINVLEENR